MKLEELKKIADQSKENELRYGRMMDVAADHFDAFLKLLEAAKLAHDYLESESSIADILGEAIAEVEGIE